MSYNILNKNVQFQGPTQGTIEDIVDDHSDQTIDGQKTFSNLSASSDVSVVGNVSASLNISASNFYANGVLVDPSGGGTITALNNQAANRLVTIGATTTELDGEANLTFDGSVFDFNASSISGSGNISGSAFYGDGSNLDNVNAETVTLAAGSGLQNSSGLLVDPSQSTAIVGSINDSDNVTVYSTADSAPRKVTVADIAGRATVPISTYTNTGGNANRVIVSIDGSGVQAQSNLTFDNSDLSLTGNLSGSGNLQLGGTVRMDGMTSLADPIQVTNDEIVLIDDSSNLVSKVSFSSFCGAIGGDGLVDNSGRLDVQVSGAVKVASDKVGISGSIAGNGLEYQGGVDSISGLQVMIKSSSPGLESTGLGLATDFSSLTTGPMTTTQDSLVYISGSQDRQIPITTFLANIAGSGLSVTSGQLTATATLDIDSLPSGTVISQTDNFVYSDSGTEKRVTFSDLEDRVFSSVSGDATIAAGGTLRLNASVAGSGLDYGSNQLSVDVSDFLTNGVDNRIVTATGTDGLNAEANLTFDGTTLVLTGSSILSGSTATFDTTQFTIQSATTTKPTLELKNTTPSDSANGPILVFTKHPSDNTGTVDNDVVGMYRFNGIDDGGNATTYAQLFTRAVETQNGSEGGEMDFQVSTGGSLESIFTVQGARVDFSIPCEIIVNEAGIDCNLRVESNVNSNAFFIDGTDGHVALGDQADSGVLLLLSGSNDEYLFQAKQQGNGYPSMFLAGESHSSYPEVFYNRGKFVNVGSISQGNLAGEGGSNTKLTIKKTGIADNSATAIVTFTVPNANHAAGFKVFGFITTDSGSRVGTFEQQIAISRVAGSIAAFAGSNRVESSRANSGGSGADFTISTDLTQSGAASASNTLDYELTIDTTDGSSTNAVIYVELLNFNDSGITMAAS